MSAALDTVPETAPSHGGTGGHEIVHHPCCADQDIALCTTDVTDDPWSNGPVTCVVCRDLDDRFMATGSCAAVCPLGARREIAGGGKR